MFPIIAERDLGDLGEIAAGDENIARRIGAELMEINTLKKMLFIGGTFRAWVARVIEALAVGRPGEAAAAGRILNARNDLAHIPAGRNVEDMQCPVLSTTEPSRRHNRQIATSSPARGRDVGEGGDGTGEGGPDLVVVVAHTDRSEDERRWRTPPDRSVLSGHDHILDLQYDGRGALAESMTEGYYVTAVDLTVDVEEKDGKRTVSWWPEFRVIDTQGVSPDPETQAAVDKFNAELSKELDVVIGTSSTALDSRKASVRTMETAMGDLIADASRDSVGADIAIINGGGIRGNREYPAGSQAHPQGYFR